MKTVLLAICLGLIGLVVGCTYAVGQNAPAHKLCAEHPLVTRDEVVKARNTGRGIHQQYLSDRDSRPPGREISVVPDTGGGDCPVDSTPRGNAAAAVGSLLYHGQLHCSAVLVTSTMILTAAHCIQGFDQSKLEFVLGTDSTHPIQRSLIYSADVHPHYDPDHFGVKDIAFAYLSNQMTEAMPVQLPDEVLPRTANLSVLHVGYGIAGAQPGARRCVNIPIKDQCDDSFSYATSNMNTCNGDSGGAAFRNTGEKVLLAGLTDWGDDACSDFGIDVDVGYYIDWIQARKSQAPRNMAYARVEPWARKTLTAGPDEIWDKLAGFGAEAKFNSLYKGRWVTWDAFVGDVEPRNEDEIPGTCSIMASAGQKTQLLLHQFPEGCSLTANTHLHFTGRLAQISPRWLDIVLAEPVMAKTQTNTEPVGEYVVSRLVTTTREVREQRRRDLRLESRHGSWSGRIATCAPVRVESPWHMDVKVPITFSANHQDHAGFKENSWKEHLTDQGFCVELWAEGYLGTQVFGTVVDAGMVGVISGTVEFGVTRIEQVTESVPVSAGPVMADSYVNVPLSTLDKYEVHVKLRNGTEQSFTESGSLGKVAINWADGKVELRSNVKEQ